MKNLVMSREMKLLEKNDFLKDKVLIIKNAIELIRGPGGPYRESCSRSGMPDDFE
ncbi:MAG TPA: hypothetical protein VJ201_08290 [Candidatus Babeliales bacterium]|nr:hypothetical protein [Candidatus Babeliales bacterium]